MTIPNARTSKKTSVTLWTIQGLLAAMFLFAGVMKLLMPVAALTHDAPLPGLFLRFVGILEVLGALGLILPGLLRLRPTLTPLAAAGLLIIMSGAFSVTLVTGQVGAAVVPVIVGILLALVALGRWTAHTPAGAR
ncbi:MAG: DoxX family protein [bacterium]